jgi:hypothetical protein
MRFSELFRDLPLSGMGVVALVLFFAVFTGAALRAAFRSRDLDERLGRMPLDDDRTEARP